MCTQSYQPVRHSHLGVSARDAPKEPNKHAQFRSENRVQKNGVFGKRGLFREVLFREILENLEILVKPQKKHIKHSKNTLWCTPRQLDPRPHSPSTPWGAFRPPPPSSNSLCTAFCWENATPTGKEFGSSHKPPDE